LNRGIEQEHATRAAYAQAELNVSDPSDRLVEAAQAEKRISANGSEAGPERRGEPAPVRARDDGEDFESPRSRWGTPQAARMVKRRCRVLKVVGRSRHVQDKRAEAERHVMGELRSD
jgi:hypothetical protein